MFSIIDWEWNLFISPLVAIAMRMHWYSPISSVYLTSFFDISKPRYDVMILVIDAFTVTPVLFSNALSCQVNLVVTLLTLVTDTTLLSDLFSWMIEISRRLVPLTTQLIFTPDLSTSTSIDMEASAKMKRFWI